MSETNFKIAVCYDFDGTLSPGNMQEYDFMKKLGISPKEFWQKSKELAEQKDMDDVLAYMYLMIKESQIRDIPFTRSDFQNYGRHVALFKGVETWFDRINTYGQQKGFEVEHYIISSGLKEMIEGTSIAHVFHRIYASSFMYDANGVAQWPAMALNYTTKTQFLFRINKGCLDINDNAGINAFLPTESRPLPFRRMIYVGDGATDIPCMRLVQASGGYSAAVYRPEEPASHETAKSLIRDKRVNIIAPADYSEGSVMEFFLKTVIDKLAAEETLLRLQK